MMLDKLTMLSEAQAVTVTAFSTNTYDLGVARDAGAGENLALTATVDTAFTAAGAATMEIQVVCSANANLSTPTVLKSTGPLAKTEFTAGRRPIQIEVPRSVLLAQPVGQRYVGLQYVVATGPMTAGAITAGVYAGTFQDVGKNYGVGFAII